MDKFISLVASPLGWIMWFFIQLINNYGAAILLFTFFTRLILVPVAFWVHKNSVKMIRMKPELNLIESRNLYDKDNLHEEQLALFKREKYNAFAGLIPLLIQIPLILCLISVINAPLTHILHMDKALIEDYKEQTAQIMQLSDEDSQKLQQIDVIRYVKNPQYADKYLQLGSENNKAVFDDIINFDMKFLGIDLSAVPVLSHPGSAWIFALLAGLSAFMMCFVQNKINVLQLEQGFWGKWCMTIFLTAFSLYFGFSVAAGVALYWIAGNLFAILQLFTLNKIYKPKKYIDYPALEESKRILDAARESMPPKRNVIFDNSPEGKREREDYKRFFKVPRRDMKLVFYSEQSGFYKYFDNIISHILNNSDLKIHYVTSDPNDKIFETKEDRIIPYYIGETKLISLMMKLSCKIIVMTTPDLNTYQIKRSYVKKNVEYIYVVHGAGSPNLTSRSGSLDHYDTVFTATVEQTEELRALETLRCTKKKRILRCGFPVLDNMLASYEKSSESVNEKPVIMLAPSWQENNILDSCLDGILDRILDRNYRVIVRPHPQYIRRFPDNMNAILKKYEDKICDDFTIETDFSSNSSVYSADILITDWSNIAQEYSFTTKKPTLFINTEMKVVNPDYQDLNIVPYDITVRDIIGKSIEKDEVFQIDNIISDMLARKNDYAAEISSELQRHFYNVGTSGEVGGNYIINRFTKKKN